MDISNNQIYVPGASDYSSDYIGFSFNGVHSDTLGIKRTSEGSRFNENLLPTIQDKTVQVPGGDGMYLFGSYYTQRQFNISYAFDALEEDDLAKIKELFGDKKIHELIFDEAPYKVYQAKVTGTASIKYIPFGEGEHNRIYKGEGNIQFTAYDPYARSVHKYLDQYANSNKEEWKLAADLLPTQGNYDKITNNREIRLYNPGVKETDFIITFNFANGVIPNGGIILDADHQLHFNRMESQDGDDQIRINTKLNLIEGYKNGKKSGKIYNRYIKSGFFFKIPVTKTAILTIDNVSTLPSCFASIDYDYIYF